MKKTDIAMLILISSVAIMIAFFVAKSIPFLQPSEDGVKVKTIDEISSQVEQPDETVFYDEAINPTVEIVVGGN